MYDEQATAIDPTRPKPLSPETMSWVASLRTLQSAAAILAQSADLPTLFDEVGEQVALVVSYHTLRLFLHDPERDELFPVAIRSFVEEFDLADLDNPSLRLPVGRGVTGHIAATRKAEVVYDLEAHPQAFHIPGTPRVDESLVGVPLVFRDELVGVLTLSRHGLSQFTSEQLAMLEVLGVSVAAAIGHRRSIEAEQAARAREARLQDLHSSFIANISHELRTPMTTAAGFLEVAESRAAESAPELAEIMEGARRGLDRLRELIEDLLEVVSLEAGRQELDLRPAGTGELLRAAVVNSGVDADRIRLDGDLDASVVVDRVRLVHVVSELLENAEKYGPEGGPISVRVHAGNGELRVDVSDGGDGIPAEEAESIFQRFTQRDPSLTRTRGGTGMGLSLARAVARAHGGELTLVDGAPTTFRLTVAAGNA